MIQPAKIANIMGGERVLQESIRSLFDLERVVEDGLPKMALKNVAGFVTSPGEKLNFIYRIVPEGTYKRRGSHLNSEESERTERIARVIATAIEIWEDKEKAKAFLTSPHSFFKNRRPIEVAFTELGARQVEELLWGIFYGLPL